MDQKKIGEYIHRYRKEKGLTQQQLAEILHVSNKAVSKWETGVNTPDTSMLIPLSEALGVSVLDLLMGSDLDKADTSEINSFGTRLSESLTLIK
ncbi:MAG: helix-turn-helix transcriptional regulator, partial [Erysipelotrichaceae bacterium]|nr:helix-turn-helix transcriptional regulator [Erysipelotrichaceae bacterium]